MHWGLTLCNPHQLQHNNPLTSLPLSSHLLLSDSGFHFSPQRGTMPDSLIKHSPRHDFHHPHQNSSSAQAAKSSLVCHQVRHPRGRISLGGFNDNQSKHAAYQPLASRQTHWFQRLRCATNKSAFTWNILVLDSLWAGSLF